MDGKGPAYASPKKNEIWHAISDYVIFLFNYHTTYTVKSPIPWNHTLAGNKIVDHSEVVWASPVGAAPTTSSFSTAHLISMDWAKTLQDETRNI